jgi:hypothetical protein
MGSCENITPAGVIFLFVLLAIAMVGWQGYKKEVENARSREKEKEQTAGRQWPPVE